MKLLLFINLNFMEKTFQKCSIQKHDLFESFKEE